MDSQSQVSFDEWMGQTTELSEKSIRSYYSAIKGSLTTRCLEYGIVKKNLLLISDADLFDDLRQCLENELRKVLDSPSYNLLSNGSKAEVLLNLENGGEYDPLG